MQFKADSYRIQARQLPEAELCGIHQLRQLSSVHLGEHGQLERGQKPQESNSKEIEAKTGRAGGGGGSQVAPLCDDAKWYGRQWDFERSNNSSTGFAGVYTKKGRYEAQFNRKHVSAQFKLGLGATGHRLGRGTGCAPVA